MVKYILLFCLFLFDIEIKSQEFNIKSPQAYEMERYGNIPVNLSVGSIDLNIPLFEQNQYHMNLQYNSSGFIPTKKSNFVGLNWGLNYGGIITRETIDHDDDSYLEGGGHNIMGFLYYVKNKKFTDEKLYNLIVDRSYLNINGYYTELTSDKYHFNFMGITGYFKINSKGQAIAYSNDPNLKIDISKLSYQYNSSCSPEPSEIIITDGSGNQYIFGGDSDALEVSYNQGFFNAPNTTPMQIYNGVKLYSVKSWMLTKVNFNNNRKLSIKYDKYEDIRMGDFCKTKNQVPYKQFINSSFFDLNFIVSQNIERSDYSFNYSNGGYYIGGKGSYFGWKSPYYQINLIKKSVPKQITIDNNFTINFEYSTQTSFNNFKYDIMLLDHIKIYYNQNLYNKI